MVLAMVMRMSALLKGMAANPMYSENALLVEMQVLVEDLVSQLLQPRSLVELAVEEVVKEGLSPKVTDASRILIQDHLFARMTLLKDFLVGAAACDEDEGGRVAVGEEGEGGRGAEEGGRGLRQGHWTCKPAALTPPKFDPEIYARITF